jgi:hypothetical protein
MLPTVIVFGHSVDLQHINIYIYITNKRVSLVWGYMGRVLRHTIPVLGLVACYALQPSGTLNVLNYGGTPAEKFENPCSKEYIALYVLYVPLV